MFIEIKHADGANVLNSRHIRSMRVAGAKSVRSFPNGAGVTTYDGMPSHGFVLVAYGASGATWLTRSGCMQPEAEHLLDAILSAVERGQKRFSVDDCLRTYRSMQPSETSEEPA